MSGIQTRGTVGSQIKLTLVGSRQENLTETLVPRVSSLRCHQSHLCLTFWLCNSPTQKACRCGAPLSKRVLANPEKRRRHGFPLLYQPAPRVRSLVMAGDKALAQVASEDREPAAGRQGSARHETGEHEHVANPLPTLRQASAPFQSCPTLSLSSSFRRGSLFFRGPGEYNSPPSTPTQKEEPWEVRDPCLGGAFVNKGIPMP